VLQTQKKRYERQHDDAETETYYNFLLCLEIAQHIRCAQEIEAGEYEQIHKRNREFQYIKRRYVHLNHPVYLDTIIIVCLFKIIRIMQGIAHRIFLLPMSYEDI